jgi:hypothetical protein
MDRKNTQKHHSIGYKTIVLVRNYAANITKNCDLDLEKPTLPKKIT